MNNRGTYAALSLVEVTLLCFLLGCSPELLGIDQPITERSNYLAFSAQPSSSADSCANWAISPVVEVMAKKDELSSTDASAITLSAYSDANCTTAASGTLSVAANPVSAVGGVATFSGLSYAGQGVIYLKAQSAGGHTSACSAAVSVVGVPSSLAFTSQPSSVTAGVAASPSFVVRELDQCGLPNTTSTSNIALRISEDASCATFSPSTLTAGSNPLVPSGGYASFTNVTLSKAGTMYLKAESATHSVCSAAITVGTNEGSGTVLSFKQIPNRALVNGNMLPQVTVAITDPQGNIIAAESDTITLAAYSNAACTVPASGALSLAANGLATTGAIVSFNQVRYNRHETVYLRASSVTHGTKCSGAIDVSGLPRLSGSNVAPAAILNPTGSVYTFGPYYVGGGAAASERGLPTRLKSLSGVVHVDAGNSFLCAVKNDGTVWCLGEGSKGQLGNSASSDSTTPVQVTGLTNAVMVATSDASSCAVRTDGTVWCWGENSATYLALGAGLAAGNYNTIQQVSGISNATAVYAGGYHMCATLRDSTVKCWGYGVNSQLGNGASVTSGVPVVVTALSQVRNLSLATSTSYATLDSGLVYAWGSDANGQLGTANATTSTGLPVPLSELGTVAALTTGKNANYTSAFASKADGSVWGWGQNFIGTFQSILILGDYALADQHLPFQLTAFSDIVQVASSFFNTAVQYADGAIRTWGRSFSGTLGQGTTGLGVGGLVSVAAFEGDTTLTGIYSGISGDGNNGLATCTTHSDGSVKCWGTLPDLVSYQHGVYRPTVLGEAGISAVSLGATTTCVRKTDNTVRCWGLGTNGQLGGGASVDSVSVPVDPGLTNVIEVSARINSVCALRSNGTVWCWGRNTANVLGNSTIALNAIRNTPAQVDGITDAKAIATNENSVCAIVDNGVAADSVKCWGRDNNGNLGDGGAITDTNTAAAVDVTGLTDVTHISGGLRHFCARKTDGTVWCWGDNASGQLGDNSVTDRSSPVQMTGVAGASSVVAGSFFTLALLADGTVKIAGSNTGRVMSSTDAAHTDDFRVARLILGLSDVTQAAANDGHACFLLNDGGVKSVKCMGNEERLGVSGPLVLNSAVTNYVHMPRRYGAGDGFSCRIEFDGRVRCWGKNASGQLGNGGTIDSNVPVYVNDIGGGAVAGADMIAVGKEHACALLADGKVYCWGENGLGQLGNNGTTDSSTPVEISTISGTVIDLVAGNGHTCAGIEGTSFNVRCWGDNTYGQLGDATFVQKLTAAATSVGPATLTSTFWDYLVAGGDHTCMVLKDRTLRCWGRNDLSQLADGSTTDRSTSVKMGNGTSHPLEPYYYAGGSGTAQHTCGVSRDGTGRVQCWGDNTYGQLGNGTTVASGNPVYVSGVTNAINVEAGGNHSCATKNDGTMWCWGRNQGGQLGNGSTVNSSVPVQVSGITQAGYHLSLGSDHSCLMLRTGSTRCWGGNASGQLGNGSNTASSIPVSPNL